MSCKTSKCLSSVTLTLTFQGHSGSKVIVSLNYPYMVSYIVMTNSKKGSNSAPLPDIRR